MSCEWPCLRHRYKACFLLSPPQSVAAGMKPPADRQPRMLPGGLPPSSALPEPGRPEHSCSPFSGYCCRTALRAGKGQGRAAVGGGGSGFRVNDR